MRFLPALFCSPLCQKHDWAAGFKGFSAEVSHTVRVRLGPPGRIEDPNARRPLTPDQLASPAASTVAFVLGVLDLCPWAAFLLESAVGITSQASLCGDYSRLESAALGRLHALATQCIPLMVSRHQILRLGVERHKWQQSWLSPGGRSAGRQRA